MTKAIFPGTFDPFTLGHLEVVRQALVFADEVIVGVASNSAKQPLLEVNRRIELIEITLREAQLETRVEVRRIEGLLADFCLAHQVDVIVKGLRSGIDFDYELPMSQMNRQLGAPPTVFVATKSNLGHVSSSLVKEVARYGVDLRGMVSPETAKELYQAFGVRPPFGGDNVIAANFEQNTEGKRP